MYFLVIIFISCIILNTRAQDVYRVSATNDTIDKIQPNGYVLKCFLRGDENSSKLITIDGHRIIKVKNKEFQYTTKDKNGKIKASGIRAKNKKDRSKSTSDFLIKERNSLIKTSKTATLSSLGKSSLLKSYPLSGSINVLVILIDYSDLSASIPTGSFNNLMNQANYNNTGSFKDYWSANSYGNLTINSTVTNWYTANYEMSYYGRNTTESNDVNVRVLVQEAIDEAENDGVDFSDYDNDGDGEVDGIIVIHAGYAEEAGADEETIWSHKSTLRPTEIKYYDGVYIKKYAIASELRFNSGAFMTNIGVICHEFGHLLGLPDLYDTDIENGDSEGIGRWGLMGSGSWNNGGASPANLCAWSKDDLGWASITELTNPSNITLTNSAENNDFYKITSPTSDEYFLLENRQFVGFDIGLPGTGLAVWHIKTSKTNQSHRDANDVNADENEKGVDLEEAEGVSDLDNTTNRGDNADLFPGSSCNSSFDDTTIPNSQTYLGLSTNKSIINIRELNSEIKFGFMEYNPIIGSDLVCTSNSIFTVEQDAINYNMVWECDTDVLTVVSGSTSSSYTVKAKSSYISDEGWIRCTMINNCGDTLVAQKDIWVGKPNMPITNPTGYPTVQLQPEMMLNVTLSV